MQLEPKTGQFCLISPEDFELVCDYVWYTVKGYNTRYAYTFINGKRLFMHRVILDAPGNLFVDHVNGNGLDNRRENIRLCTHAENARNRRVQRRPSPFGSWVGYKGVQPYCGGFSASICKDGTIYKLGKFATEVEAAMAYNEAALRIHGEFACLNEM